MGPSGRPGGTADLQRTGRIPPRGSDPRHHRRPPRPPRHPARGPVDHQYLHAADCDIRGMLSKLRPERASVYQSAEIAVGESEKPANSVAVLLQAKYRRTTFAIWASAFLSLFCIFGLSGWIPTVMMQRGETFAASFGFGALMQIMLFVAALVLGHLVDKSGR